MRQHATKLATLAVLVVTIAVFSIVDSMARTTMAYGQTSVANSASDLAGKHVVTWEGPSTISGLMSFSRSASPPFAVNLGAAAVTNLDADKVDGQHGAYYLDLANATGTLAAARLANVPVSAGGMGLIAGVSGGIAGFTSTSTMGSSTLLDATAIMVGGGAGQTPSTDANWTINAQHQVSSATQFRAIAYSNAAQSISNATVTALTLNAEDLDIGSLHDNVTNNTRLTIPTGGNGFYVIIVSTQFAASVTGSRQLIVQKNGANVQFATLSAVGASVEVMSVPYAAALVATDYIEFSVFQDSGGALNAGSATRNIASSVTIFKLF